MVATNIRKEAREALTNKWIKGIAIILLEGLITVVMTGIINAFKDESIFRTIFSIIETIVQVPLSIGVIFSFIKLKWNEEVNCYDFIKIAYENFSRAWALYFRVILKMIIPIICIIVAIILVTTLFLAGGTAGMVQSAGERGLGLLTLGVIIYVVALTYAVMMGLKYALTFFIAYDNKDMSAKEVVEKSEKLMVGHRGDLFLLNLSFLGWEALCFVPGIFFAIMSVFNLGFLALVLICRIAAGVGMLFIAVYVQTANICFYDDVLNLNKEAEVITDKE